MHYACTLLNAILTMNSFIWLPHCKKVRKIRRLILLLLIRFFTDSLRKYVRLLKSKEGSAKVICFVKIPNFSILLNWKKKIKMFWTSCCRLWIATYRPTIEIYMALIWRVLSNDIASIFSCNIVTISIVCHAKERHIIVN